MCILASPNFIIKKYDCDDSFYYGALPDYEVLWYVFHHIVMFQIMMIAGVFVRFYVAYDVLLSLVKIHLHRLSYPIYI